MTKIQLNPSHASKVVALSLMFSSILFESTPPASASPQFNVKTYGAKGDGITDDTTAIIAALTAADGESGTLLFPQGTYLYTKQLDVLLGDITLTGQNATLLSGNSTSWLDLTGKNINVTGLKFDSKTGTQNAVLANQGRNFVLTNNAFTNKFNYAIKFQDVIGGSINGNLISTASGVGMFLDLVDNMLIEKNTVTSTSANNYGLYSEQGQQLNINKNSFTNSSADTTSIGIYDSNAVDNTIQGNTLSQYATNIETVSALDDNIIYNNSTGSKTAAIMMQHPNGGTITGNTCQNETGLGIVVHNATNASTINLNANTLSNIASAPIDAAGTGGTTIIDNNRISNSGTAASPKAVILVNQPQATSISVSKNDYTGSANNFQFFVHILQKPPVASQSGNKTNTTLPSLP